MKFKYYDGTNWTELLDTGTAQNVTGVKTFGNACIKVAYQVGQVNNYALFYANGIEVFQHIGGAHPYTNQGKLLYPEFLVQEQQETIATREWVQSQGSGGSQQYLHTVTIEGLDMGAYYTFTFCFLTDYNTPIEDIEELYNYLLDETNNLDVYGSGSFCNCTYAGTSTANRVYDANRIMIENDTLFIEGYAMFSSQFQASIDKAKAFICYGDRNDYWGWDGRIIDNVSPA